MEDDSISNHQGFARSPLSGMESVIATVSGYHGSERFNLIKLIARTGASYVGNMYRSITHLVCWKFEGRKYELAKKFKIAIVNHCWIEECIKKGRRVPEDPYVLQSGEEMGPLVLDINQLKAQSEELRNSKRPVVDVECEHVTNAVSADTVLFGEKHDSHCSNKSIETAIKRTSRKDRPSSSRDCHENLSGSKIMELEEASTSQAAKSCRLKKRNSTSPEPRSKGRRLVKKHTSIKDYLLTSNVEDEHKELKMETRNKSMGVRFDISDVERHQSTSDTRHTLIGQDNTDTHGGVREIVHLDEEDKNSHSTGVSSSLATSEVLQEAGPTDSTRLDPAEKLPVSCVICLTDFSSTRGVLPCGHRFCFLCIQNWADQMTSKGKASTCPLCKASFICISKVDDAVSSDQKIYSQTITNDSSKIDHYILPPDQTYTHRVSLSAPVCCRCSATEPKDLLKKCHFCQIRCIHTYCLDPPSDPWVCVHCIDLQRLYLHTRS